jgi:hypothetical protein
MAKKPVHASAKKAAKRGVRDLPAKALKADKAASVRGGVSATTLQTTRADKDHKVQIGVQLVKAGFP